MKLLRGSHHFPVVNHPTIATVGNFDGFHLGHQEIVRLVVQQARQQQLHSVVVSFEPTPKEFFAGQQAPARIYPLREKFEIAQSLGIDYLACIRFNPFCAQMSATDFVKKLLCDSLQMKSLIVGDNFRFGHQRGGDIHLLRDLGKQLGFSVMSQDTIAHKDVRISSSLVREKLSSSQFDEVASLLGRPFTMSGKVFHGDKKGRTIGFPTANILLRRKVSPIHGVFTISATLKNKHWNGVANIGSRPTVHGQREQLEAHLFNCQEDLYGQRLTIEFHTQLRAEKKFSSLEELKKQIALDVQKAQQYFTRRNQGQSTL